MALSLVSGPAVEPLTVDDARTHLRVPTFDDDAYLHAMIPVVRQRAERATRRVFITQTWDQWLDTWPVWNGYHGGRMVEPDRSLLPPGGFVWLPQAPLQAIVSVEYVDLAGNWQTWPAENYVVDAPTGMFASRGRLGLQWARIWPVIRPIANAVKIRMRCGYGDAASDVPALLRQAMLLDMGTLFDIRSGVMVGTRAQAIEIPSTARDIYRSFLCR